MLRKALIIMGVCSGLLLAFLAVLALLGTQIDPNHQIVVVKTIPVPQQKVWELVSNVKLIPQWNQTVKTVQITESNPLPQWEEEYQTGQKMSYRFTLLEPPTKLIREVVGKDAPFAGEWIIELREMPDGTEVKITENGRIGNPLIRFIAHRIMGLNSFISQYIDAINQAANSS